MIRTSLKFEHITFACFVVCYVMSRLSSKRILNKQLHLKKLLLIMRFVTIISPSNIDFCYSDGPIQSHTHNIINYLINRKGRAVDMFRRREFRFVPCCSWWFRTIWDHNQGKNCPRKSSTKGNFPNSPFLVFVGLIYYIFLVPFITI